MVQDCGMQNVVESGGLADVFGCTALVADNVGGGGGGEGVARIFG